MAEQKQPSPAATLPRDALDEVLQFLTTQEVIALEHASGEAVKAARDEKTRRLDVTLTQLCASVFFGVDSSNPHEVLIFCKRNLLNKAIREADHVVVVNDLDVLATKPQHVVAAEEGPYDNRNNAQIIPASRLICDRLNPGPNTMFYGTPLAAHLRRVYRNKEPRDDEDISLCSRTALYLRHDAHGIRWCYIDDNEQPQPQEELLDADDDAVVEVQPRQRGFGLGLTRQVTLPHRLDDEESYDVIAPPFPDTPEWCVGVRCFAGVWKWLQARGDATRTVYALGASAFVDAFDLGDNEPTKRFALDTSDRCVAGLSVVVEHMKAGAALSLVNMGVPYMYNVNHSLLERLREVHIDGSGALAWGDNDRITLRDLGVAWLPTTQDNMSVAEAFLRELQHLDAGEGVGADLETELRRGTFSVFDTNYSLPGTYGAEPTAVNMLSAVLDHLSLVADALRQDLDLGVEFVALPHGRGVPRVLLSLWQLYMQGGTPRDVTHLHIADFVGRSQHGDFTEAEVAVWLLFLWKFSRCPDKLHVTVRAMEWTAERIVAFVDSLFRAAHPTFKRWLKDKVCIHFVVLQWGHRHTAIALPDATQAYFSACDVRVLTKGLPRDRNAVLSWVAGRSKVNTTCA